VQITASALEQIHALYDDGLFLQAYGLLKGFGEPEAIEGTGARLIAARLLSQLGGDARAAALFYRTYRSDRASLDARYFYVRTVLRRSGPLAAWKLARKPLPAAALASAPPDGGGAPTKPMAARGPANERLAEWHALQASILGSLRDFDRAYAALDRADQLAPDHPWILLERAGVLEAEDRYDEALAVASRSLSCRPHYGPAAHSAAHLLHLLGRDAEALAVLTDAATHTESSFISAQLTTLQIELRLYEEARRSLAQAVERMPLAEDAYAKWAAACAFEIAYALGDYGEAVTQARSCDIPYFTEIASHIEAAGAAARRVVLTVGFVRQHHMTCAPATLSALSSFWKMPADHLEIAEAICYDGTPWHSERAWADSHGWQTREFMVTWEAARALVDRGIPFTLTTAGPGYAHLQAIVGYDERQGTLLIRDPFTPYLLSPLGPEMLKSLLPYGPRGLAMVPEDRRELLDGLELQDAALYDGLHAVERALKEHRRPEAAAKIAEIAAAAPDHPVTLHARRAIAAYDSDLPAHLAVIEAMREQFPDEPNLAVAHLRCLRELDRREERLSLLEALTSRPIPKTDDAGAARADAQAQTQRMAPIFWQQYARELSDDAREHPRVVTLLARAMRYAPTDGENYHTLATVHWRAREFEEATELYRFAACLEPFSESLSRSYFVAACWLRRADEATAFLRSRFDRHGGRSAQPAITLFGALEQLGRQQEMFGVLEAALALRPDDSDLLLFAVDATARYGRFAEAESYLGRAQGHTTRASWLRGVAGLADLRGDTAQSLSAWREIAEAEPLAMDALEAIARLLTQTEGPVAAARHYETLAARFPHHAGVHRQWAVWLRGQDDPPRQIEVLNRLKAIDSVDSWCRRELALVLAEERRFDEALAEAETAEAIDPLNSSSVAIVGEVKAAAGETKAARQAFRRALTLRIDDVFALKRLIELCDTADETREVLQFAANEMANQTLFGESLLGFRWYAHRMLRPEEVDGLVWRVLQARPDLWQAWSAWIDELRETDRLPDAQRIAEEATGRFPLTPQLWQDLAAVKAARGDHAGEREALQQALSVTPADCELLRALADSWTTSGEIDRGRELLERAIAMDPLDPQNHASLAYHLWVTNARDAAVARVHHILRLDPTNTWAWAVLRPWSSELGRAAEADQTARELAARRPRDPRSWITLARVLHRPSELAERLEALDHAIRLDPRCYEARDLKATLLSAERRFTEAIAACSLPNTPESGLPIRLRARLAQIAADRGDLRAAVRMLDSALLTDPSYYEGWLALLEWRKELKDLNGAIDAARRMTRLRPHNPTAWGYLGYALLEAKQTADGWAALRRSLELDPSYEYGAFTLVAAQLESGAFAEADETIRIVLAHRHEGWPLALAIQVAAKRRDGVRASALLQELGLLPGRHEGALQHADEALQAAGMTADVRAACEPLLGNSAAQAEVGALWARACAQQNLWQEAERLAPLAATDALKGRAASGWIGAMERANRSADLHRFVEANRGWARASTPGWAAIAYGLLSLRDYPEVVRWTNDWRVRDGAGPWMLMNRAIALRYNRQEADAADVSRAALELEEDQATVNHALWLTIDAGLAGDRAVVDRLARFLQGREPDDLQKFYQFLYWVAQAMEAMASDSDDGSTPGERFALSRERLAAARKARPDFRGHRLLRSAYWRAAWRIARDSRIPWACVWYGWHALTAT